LWSTSASPAISPIPGTTLITPGGAPYRLCHISVSLIADKGVISAGFKTHVEPDARVGAILKILINPGKFQGVISPQTPTGLFIVYPN
jgi:hypothetical protein